MLEETQLNLVNLQKNLFLEKNGKFFLGGEEIKGDILSLLKDEARYIEKSQLWELLHAAVLNEAARSAFESSNWENVQFAKALKYYDTIIRNILSSLTKN